MSMRMLLVSLSWLCACAASAGQSLTDYANMCARDIGPIPAFDCTQGELVPITVHGQEPLAYTQGMSCDRPALLPYDQKGNFGQCTPYSRIHNLSQGHIKISAFCRREFLRPAESPLYDEVDIVMHNLKSGATCWLHAQNKPGQKPGFDASRVPPANELLPPPGKVAAKDFWWQPAATASKNCGACHDADPFMYSPWLGQKWAQVPQDPLGKYFHLGKDFTGKGWQSAALSTRDNTCVGCHRIGNQESCKTFIEYASGRKVPAGGNDWANSYPLNHWMPVQNAQSQAFWQQVHGDSVDQLLECCRHPQKPGCSLMPITAKQ